MKKLLFTQTNNTPHWVGDGFYVCSIFSYVDFVNEVSPFLLMDYMSPTEFPPSSSNDQRGVGVHPHRGFETVTIVFSGEVEHRDSSGGGGVISKGGVQWMTAGAGIVHEERHSKEFSKTGGMSEGIQLWVNLPKKHKMTPPNYQSISSNDIPTIHLGKGGGYIRVIAGELFGKKGPEKHLLQSICGILI